VRTEKKKEKHAVARSMASQVWPRPRCTDGLTNCITLLRSRLHLSLHSRVTKPTISASEVSGKTTLRNRTLLANLELKAYKEFVLNRTLPEMKRWHGYRRRRNAVSQRPI
jgi:hypothetical protein